MSSLHKRSLGKLQKPRVGYGILLMSVLSNRERGCGRDPPRETTPIAPVAVQSSPPASLLAPSPCHGLAQRKGNFKKKKGAHSALQLSHSCIKSSVVWVGRLLKALLVTAGQWQPKAGALLGWRGTCCGAAAEPGHRGDHAAAPAGTAAVCCTGLRPAQVAACTEAFRDCFGGC